MSRFKSSETLKPQLEHIDLRPCLANERAAAINSKPRRSCANRLISKKGRRCKLSLLRLDDEDHALVIKLHHLVTDGWSQRLFWEELGPFRSSLEPKAG